VSDEPKRGRGRPPAGEHKRIISVSTYFSSAEYQRLFEAAKRDEKSLAAKLRERYEARKRTE
jgi:hypothetical protein